MISASQISASQIKASACLRKWAARSVCHFPKVETPAQAFGLEGHDHAFRWLTTGVSPDQTSAAGRLMCEGIPHLPQPGHCLCECDLTGRPKPEQGHGQTITIDGVPFIGYIDVLGLSGDMPIVIDHKFTGRPELALTPETLPHDVQAIIYGYAATRLFGADRCWLRWLYYPKSGGRLPFPVDVELGRAQIEDSFWTSVYPAAKFLHDFAQRAPLLKPDQAGMSWLQQIPCNPESCDWVGKWCDYANYCNKE